jgi:restriction system protein
MEVLSRAGKVITTMPRAVHWIAASCGELNRRRMKFKMAKNSLFAVLLRSPWWVSFAILAGIILASRALLPEPYAPFGMMSGLPFLVIGTIAAWKRSRAPDPVRVSEALARVGSQSWRDFSNLLELGYRREGYTVTRLDKAAADLQLSRDGALTLVSCKRWKAANHGVDALRDLSADRQALAAQHCVYISLADVSEKARQYAKEQGITLMGSQELTLFLLGKS